MRKFIAVILCLGMLAALAGCGAGSVVGTWTGRGDALEAVSAGLDPELVPYLTTVPYDVTITLEKDGSYTYSLDLAPSVDALKASLRSYFEDYIAASGFTVEFFESAMGMSLDDYIAEAAEGMATSESGSGTYTFEKGVLTLDPGTTGEIVCSVNGSSFELTTDLGSVTMNKAG